MNAVSWDRLLIQTIVWALLVGVPIWAMVSCSGWNEGSGSGRMVCSPDWGVVRSLASSYYFLVTMASFMMGIPLLFYLAITAIIGVWLSRRLT